MIDIDFGVKRPSMRRHLSCIGVIGKMLMPVLDASLGHQPLLNYMLNLYYFSTCHVYKYHVMSHIRYSGMSFSKPAKYERFYWGGGGDGDAYYSKHLAALLCPLLEEVKPRLTSAIGKWLRLHTCM